MTATSNNHHRNTTKKHIVVGLSGGVDSAVSALLLANEGHHLQAVFMQNWKAASDDPYCTAEQDLSDARAVCDLIGIPLSTVDFSKKYWDLVFQRCLDDFAAGFTPNPDILCNSEIKFKCFLEHAKQLGANVIATGHYARIEEYHGQQQLKRGLDARKDQSYFLHALKQTQLQHACFPLGHLQKKEVREIAAKAKFSNATKADSTGICFIGERRFKPFLSEYLLAQPGNIEDDHGNKIGSHDGLMFYTIGQRKGLHIGGQKNYQQAPWYVLEKRQEDNVLVVGQGHDHPKLYQKYLIAGPMHWIEHTNKQAESISCQAQIRYLQAPQACQITPMEEGYFHVEFQKPQWAIAAGQSLVLYDNDRCLGGGIIQKTPKTTRKQLDSHHKEKSDATYK